MIKRLVKQEKGEWPDNFDKYETDEIMWILKQNLIGTLQVESQINHWDLLYYPV